MVFEPDRKVDDTRRASSPLEDVFEGYPVGSWTADNASTLAFPVLSISESGGNRIIERERPYREGAKLDDTGRKATQWTMVCVFENTISEPGLEVNGLKNLYPDVLNDLIASFAIHKTGDLVVPTRGTIRARIVDYGRDERFDERNTARLNVVYKEDNEDSVDANALAAPAASAFAFQLADKAEFSAQNDGMWDTSLQDLKELAANLEGLANAPDNFLLDLEEQANIIMNTHDKVIQTFSRATVEGRDTFLNADSSRTRRQLALIKEIAGKTRFEARRARPRLDSRVFESTQSLPSIAAMLAVDINDLIAANPQLSNPLYIPTGTIVRIPVDGKTNRQG
jgi:prophage DNA circulation protein